jgi:hypothetical protein
MGQHRGYEPGLVMFGGDHGLANEGNAISQAKWCGKGGFVEAR